MSHQTAYRALTNGRLETYRKHLAKLDRDELSPAEKINAIWMDDLVLKSQPFTDGQIQAHQRELGKYRKRRPFMLSAIIETLTDAGEYRSILRTQQKLNALGHPDRFEFKKLWRSQSITFDQAVNLCGWFGESELDVMMVYAHMAQR